MNLDGDPLDKWVEQISQTPQVRNMIHAPSLASLTQLHKIGL